MCTKHYWQKKFYRLAVVSLVIMNSCGTDEGDVAPSPTPSPSIVNVIEDEFESQKYIVYANSTYRTMVAYSRVLEDGTLLNFEQSNTSFPAIVQDQEGTTWNIFGRAVSGPRVGQKLMPIRSMMGYWFSFASFFPEVTIYGEDTKERFDDKINGQDWLINPDNVFRAAFKDAIPSLDYPSYNKLSGQDLVGSLYVDDRDLVIVVPGQENIKVIPHKVMDWHESLNDNINDKKMVVAYCPLTGTTTFWDRKTEGNVLEFGVSGLLYNNNLILYDRQTESYWSQILQKSVHGELIGNDPANAHVAMEMTWAGVKLLKGGVINLLSNDTGFDRNYSVYPYGDYKTNHDRLSFPLTYEDSRVPNKERVMAVIINERSKVYRFEHFE